MIIKKLVNILSNLLTYEKRSLALSILPEAARTITAEFPKAAEVDNFSKNFVKETPAAFRNPFIWHPYDLSDITVPCLGIW
jgi:hypothetical protein